MKLCKTCKHWRRGGQFDWKNGIFGNLPTKEGDLILTRTIIGRAESVIISQNIEDRFGLCLHEKVSSDYVNDWLNRGLNDSTDSIYAGDEYASDNGAGLRVGEDFGCIHHEEKINET